MSGNGGRVWSLVRAAIVGARDTTDEAWVDHVASDYADRILQICSADHVFTSDDAGDLRYAAARAASDGNARLAERLHDLADRIAAQAIR